jgi:signal transduction histidine kinase
MIRFRSYRTKLQAAFLLLGLAAIGLTGWVATTGATLALRQATYDRLVAIRETRARQIERYFEDVGNHVLALSSDEAAITALEQLRDAWKKIPPSELGSQQHTELMRHYRNEFAPRLEARPENQGMVDQWFPREPRTVTLQHAFLEANPHPVGSKDLLLAAPQLGPYSDIHARFHPTLHRYQTAFGFYDIFLIEASEARLLYTVFKEVDVGVSLHQEPYRSTGLARVFRKALQVEGAEGTAIEDYSPYAPSYFAPAAFLAAPIRRAGVVIGVLAIQVSLQEVNRVMTSDGQWREEGLGETGQAYIVGSDHALRSDLRFEIEHPDEYFAHLQRAGVAPEVIDRIRRHGTAILNLPVTEDLAAALRRGDGRTEAGVNFRGVDVLRSHSRLEVPGLEWYLVAEIEAGEAYAPVSDLQWRVAILAAILVALLVLAAGQLGRSVTRPVLALEQSARRLGERDFRTRIAVESDDEVGLLAASFNRMAEELERTTVSRAELELLARRLIAAQEEERSRVARELHDDLTQRLAAVAIEAGRLQRIPPQDAGKLRAGLDNVKQQMARISEDVHRLSRRLHPSTLDDLGLVAAIESECRSFFERGGAPVHFTHAGDLDEITPHVRLALYRIVQESLRNIQRHAGAQEVSVHAEGLEDRIELEVRDDGQGFRRDDPAWRPGLGLASMEERARLLGGDLGVSSAPGQGTRVRARLPRRAGTNQALEL